MKLHYKKEHISCTNYKSESYEGFGIGTLTSGSNFNSQTLSVKTNFLIFILVLQQLDGNVIGPKILGNSTGLSAFWVVFSILLGGGLFGFVGMIMGVPTFAVVYYIITMLINHLLEKKKLPLQTSEYGEKSYVDDSGRFVRENPEENDTAVKNGENKKERK